jgi:DNA replication protein DnaC
LDLSNLEQIMARKYPGIFRELTPEEDQAILAKQAEAARPARRSYTDLLADFDCGERFANATLESYRVDPKRPKQAEVLATAKRYADTLPERASHANGALFYGPPGTGKDHLAVGIAKRAMEAHGWPCRWVYGLDFYGELRSAIGSNKPEREVLRQYEAPKLLILSDPVPPITETDRKSGGALTTYQVEMLARLVEARNRARKLTITTINVKDGKEAADRIGAPTWSRLRDNAWVFPCAWDDHRQPAFIVGTDL